jgi:hypothetical protein
MKIQCANHGCPHTAHSITVKMGLPGHGESHGDQWFCSRKCYKNFLADKLIAEKRSGLSSTLRRVKLGLLLVKNNLINHQQLTAALAEKSGSLKKLGQILIETGQLTEKELKAALSMQAGIAPINLDPHTKIKLKDQVPFKLVDEFHFVLFEYDEEDKTLIIALHNMDYIPILENYFSLLYPGFLIKFYLEDEKRIIEVIAANYPNETVGPPIDENKTQVSIKKGEDIEKAILTMVELLNQFTGSHIKIDSLDNAVWLKGETQHLKVDVYLSRKGQAVTEPDKEAPLEPNKAAPDSHKE